MNASWSSVVASNMYRPGPWARSVHVATRRPRRSKVSVTQTRWTVVEKAAGERPRGPDRVVVGHPRVVVDVVLRVGRHLGVLRRRGDARDRIGRERLARVGGE